MPWTQSKEAHASNSGRKILLMSTLSVLPWQKRGRVFCILFCIHLFAPRCTFFAISSNCMSINQYVVRCFVLLGLFEGLFKCVCVCVCVCVVNRRCLMWRIQSAIRHSRLLLIDNLLNGIPVDEVNRTNYRNSRFSQATRRINRAANARCCTYVFEYMLHTCTVDASLDSLA